MATITFYSLYDYNCGELLAKTFDLDNYEECAELISDIHAWLQELTKQINDGVLREEWIVADYEDIPEKYVGEHSLDSEYFTYVSVLNELSEWYMNDAENILQAWIDYGYPLDAEQVKDAYVGHYATPRDFGEEYLAELEDLSNIPERLRYYIDWERMAEDELINTYWVSKGYTFFRV
ncbi:antirestriction protein ArdA [Spartinivicinus marinus]|nr:antirestriction protein ArdA [Spartinivicinus marinus]MCX4024727.1 antirestriction protein ArdA [Spartinivicinus marinus]